MMNKYESARRKNEPIECWCGYNAKNAYDFFYHSKDKHGPIRFE